MQNKKFNAVLIQFLFWAVSVAFAAGTYFHTQQTVNAKVLKVEKDAQINAKILCHIAIEFKVKKAQNICTREIFTNQ